MRRGDHDGSRRERYRDQRSGQFGEQPRAEPGLDVLTFELRDGPDPDLNDDIVEVYRWPLADLRSSAGPLPDPLDEPVTIPDPLHDVEGRLETATWAELDGYHSSAAERREMILLTSAEYLDDSLTGLLDSEDPVAREAALSIRDELHESWASLDAGLDPREVARRIQAVADGEDLSAYERAVGVEDTGPETAEQYDLGSRADAARCSLAWAACLVESTADLGLGTSTGAGAGEDGPSPTATHMASMMEKIARDLDATADAVTSDLGPSASSASTAVADVPLVKRTGAGGVRAPEHVVAARRDAAALRASAARVRARRDSPAEAVRAVRTATSVRRPPPRRGLGRSMFRFSSGALRRSVRAYRKAIWMTKMFEVDAIRMCLRD